MKKSQIIVLIVFALLTTLACSLFTGTVASDETGSTANSTILFQDDFSDPNSGWDRADWESGVSDYGNGVYRMLVKIPSYDIWANPGKFFDGDLRVEADATKVGGEDDNDYGLICRYSGEPSNPNYYFFVISSDGYSVIGKVTDGETEYLSSEKMNPSTAIQLGAATNKLRADCIGNNLTFYVNDIQVASTSDASFASGDVGFIAGTFDVPSTEIVFDNLVVSKP